MSWDRENQVLVFLFTIATVLWFVNFFTDSNVYTTSFDLFKTEQRINNLYKENMQLKNELLGQESYTKIDSEAASEGFIKAPFITP